MLKQLDVLIGVVTLLTLVSLFITVINQAVLNALHLRGKNLLDGLEAMFATVAPNQADNAKALAEAVLRHPLISDSIFGKSRRGLASAIRPEELTAILATLAGAEGNNSQWVGNTAMKYSQTPAVTPSPSSGTDPKTTVDVLGRTAKDVLTALQGTGGQAAISHQKVVTLLSSIPALDPAIALSIQNEAQNAFAVAQSAEANAKQWFNTMEDRTGQWLSTHAQICTCAVALVLAFGMQLDLFRIVRDLNADDTARAALLASAGDVQAESEKILKVPSTSSTQEQQGQLQDTAKALKAQAASVQKRLEKTSFQIIPAKYPTKIGTWLGVGKTAKSGWCLDVSHFIGMFCMFSLLTMGAPFWFNVLKALTNFRPALSQKVDDDRKK